MTPVSNANKLEKTRYTGVFKRRGKYEIKYKDSDGKWHREQRGRTAREASEIRSDLISKLYRGERIVTSTVTVGEVYERWIKAQEGRLKPNTIRTYREKLSYYALPSLETRQVKSVSVGDIAELVASMQKDGRKAWTIRGTLVPLSRLFSWSVREGLCPANPVQQLERWEKPQTDQREPQILSTGEVARLLEHSETHRPLFTTAVFSGLRHGELLSLTWNDVDMTSGYLCVQDSKTKAGVRKVVMVPQVRKELAALKLASSSERVFLPNFTMPLKDRQRYIQRRFKYALKRAEINRPLTVHDLRHTFASILISQGHDAAFIAAQMGHSSIATTYRVYGHLFDREGKEEKMRKMFEEGFGA